MQIPPTIFPEEVSDRCVFIYRNSTSVWKSIFEHNYINCGNNCCTGAVLLYGSLCICKNRIPIQECNLCTGVICTYGTGSDIPDPTVPDCSESWTSGHDTGIVPAKLIQCIWNISSETVLYVIAEGTGRSGVAGRL